MQQIFQIMDQNQAISQLQMAQIKKKADENLKKTASKMAKCLLSGQYDCAKYYIEQVYKKNRQIVGVIQQTLQFIGQKRAYRLKDQILRYCAQRTINQKNTEFYLQSIDAFLIEKSANQEQDNQQLSKIEQLVEWLKQISPFAFLFTLTNVITTYASNWYSNQQSVATLCTSINTTITSYNVTQKEKQPIAQLCEKAVIAILSFSKAWTIAFGILAVLIILRLIDRVFAHKCIYKGIYQLYRRIRGGASTDPRNTQQNEKPKSRHPANIVLKTNQQLRTDQKLDANSSQKNKPGSSDRKKKSKR